MNIDDLTLLSSALRARPDTVEELAKLQAVDSERFEPALRRLQAAGHLSVAGDMLSYHRPDTTIPDLARRSLSAASADFARTIEQMQEALEALPTLQQDWDFGASDAYRPHIDIITGKNAPADIWRLQSSRILPRTADICMPDAAPLFDYRDAYSHAHWNSGAERPATVRFLMSTTDATHPDGQDRIRNEIAAGVNIRMHPSPPSYFWITDDIVGIPREWGETWPEQVIAIRSPALAEALTTLFDHAWKKALPLDPEHALPWDGMLHLMSQGLTIEAAAHACELSARTGRRRIAAAMQHYGVTSHFALGAAWQRDEASRQK